MMKYYWLSFNDKECDTIACAPACAPLSHRLITEVSENKSLPFALELHYANLSPELIIGPVCGKHYDYQANSLAWPLMSDSLRDIIESNLTGEEGLSWVQARLNGDKDSYFTYNIPVFSNFLDTVNLDKSTIIKSSGMIIKPCFDMNKISRYSIFHGHSLFWQITSKIYVNEIIKNTVELNRLTGISFSEVTIA